MRILLPVAERETTVNQWPDTDTCCVQWRPGKLYSLDRDRFLFGFSELVTFSERSFAGSVSSAGRFGPILAFD